MIMPHGLKGARCQELLGQVSDYIDGELEAAVCAELEAHLAECHDCRIMVDTVRRTILLYRCEPDPKLPEGVRQRLFEVLKLGE
jgi:predicted anti-sigma-YlaC factor YlaD